MRIEFEGLKINLPDDFSPDEVTAAIEDIPRPTRLLSTEGISSTLRLVGPSLARGILGSQLGSLEEVQAARDAARSRGEVIEATDDEKDTLEQIRIKHQAIKEADLEIEKIRGRPTKPLEIAQSVVQSVAGNLPGVTAAVAARNIGPLAVAPALQAAGEQAFGQEFATARVSKGAGVEESLRHARTAEIAEAGFELLPTAWLIKNLGKTGAVEFAAKYIGRELATELPTTAVQKISERINIEPDKPLGEFLSELGRELVDTALVVPFAAGITGVVARGTFTAGEAGKGRGEVGLPPQASPPPGAPPPGAPPSPASGQPGVNLPLTPAFDQPTNPPDAQTKADLDTLIDSIDADLLDDKQVDEAKKVVAEFEKQREAAKSSQNAPAWLPLDVVPTRAGEDVGDLGASPRQAANAPPYLNPNIGDRKTRPVLYGPEGTVGLPLAALPPQLGTYVIGEETLDRPTDYMTAHAETYEQWRQKWMPNSTIVLSNEQLPSAYALGWYYNSGANFHFIVPGVLRNIKDPKAFNPNTRATVFFTAAHEFGHALVENRFSEGIANSVAKQADLESQAGLISEGVISKLPELQAAVVQEYNGIKARILDGSMLAQEFVETWLSPGKLAREGLGEAPTLGLNWLKGLGVAPSAPALQVVKALARRTAGAKLGEQAVGARYNEVLAKYLSLHEYLAEQTARAAYRNKWDEGSALDRFLKNIVSTLRKFFTDLKQDQIIAPGVAFQAWLDSLTMGAPSERAAAARKMAGKKAGEGKKAAKPTPKAKAEAKPKVKVQHNVETRTTKEQTRAVKLLRNLQDMKAIPESEVPRLQKLIEEENWDSFIDEFQKYAAKTVKFELDGSEPTDWTQAFSQNISVLRAGMSELEARLPSRIAEALQEWKDKSFRSKFFKAWFGDWENDPANASKVRRGAIIRAPVSATPAPTQTLPSTGFPQEAFAIPGTEIAGYGGEPLVLAHATRSVVRAGEYKGPSGIATSVDAFTSFSKGDLGFHFGTLRAAHNRINWGEYQAAYDPEKPQLRLGNEYIIRAVLNLRNPLYIGSEAGMSWASPEGTSGWLYNKGLITRSERDAVVSEVGHRARTATQYLDLYEAYEPLRQVLLAKGYDGIVYDNQVEGDVSFVAFHPNQVKSILGPAGTFSRSDMMHMELDYDAATPEGAGMRKLWDGIRNFLPNPSALRRASRAVLRGMRYGLQIQQMAHMHPDISWLQLFLEHGVGYGARKSTAQAAADRVVGEWSSPWLGKANFKLIRDFVREMRASGEMWFKLEKTADGWKYQPDARTLEEFNRRGIDEATGKIVLDAYNAHSTQLNMLERSLLTVAQNRYAAGNIEAYLAQARVIKHTIHQIRKRGSWPGGRFGQYMLTVERQNVAGRWEVVHREAFEDSEKWDHAWKEASARKRPDEKIRKHELQERDYVLMSLPFDFIDLAASELDLKPGQVETLLSLLQPARPEKALSKYDLERLRLPGHSEDELRSFADFTWHNANLIAKIEFQSKFNQAISYGRSELRQAEYSTDPGSLGEVSRLTSIVRAMEDARDFAMAPQHEAQTLRMWLSVMYLGLNVKTALVNFFGLVTTAHDLTTRFGLASGTARFVRAVVQATATFQLQLSQARKSSLLPDDLQLALDRALIEGGLSQSYAYHLAGMANASSLWRLPATNNLQRITRGGIDIAMFPFRLTELATRRITFLAEYEAAKDQPSGEITDPYDEAVRRTNILQGEYSHLNRVPLMRGGALALGPVMPVATVFYTWLQNMAWHTYGGYELGERRRARLEGRDPANMLYGYTARIWLTLLLLAGYEGLPGMENILDLVSAAWRKLGGKKPIRQHLREMIQAVDIDWLSPGLAAHGLMHDVFGFDISKSLGLGRFIPGTDVLARSREQPEEQFGALALDLFGVAGATMRFVLGLLFSDKPFGQRLERTPGGLGNVYVAYRWSERGVRAPNGAMVTRDLETGKLRDLTTGEIFGKALGFNPTVVAQNREILAAQRELKTYWLSQRDMLLDAVWDAHIQKDKEAQADVKANITVFNSNIPAEFKGLRISGRDLYMSRLGRRREMQATEDQTSTLRRLRPVYRDVKESFGRP